MAWTDYPGLLVDGQVALWAQVGSLLPAVAPKIDGGLYDTFPLESAMLPSAAVLRGSGVNHPGILAPHEVLAEDPGQEQRKVKTYKVTVT